MWEGGGRNGLMLGVENRNGIRDDGTQLLAHAGQSSSTRAPSPAPLASVWPHY